jgi:hypothetical protein
MPEQDNSYVSTIKKLPLPVQADTRGGGEAGGIHSLESIPGPHTRLNIRAQTIHTTVDRLQRIKDDLTIIFLDPK